MSKSYKKITGRIMGNMKAIGKEKSGVMQGFQSLSKAAMEDGALDEKTKEFVALAIGVGGQCDGCIGFHTKKLIDLGCTREEFVEVLGVCVYMGGGPKLMYAAEAMHAFDEFSGSDD